MARYDPKNVCASEMYDKVCYNPKEIVGSAILQPASQPQQPQKIQISPLPCIVIFVHGVNSEGEWYEKAEEQICKGLNKRLNRSDIKENRWERDKNGNYKVTVWNKSPVIPFFWGYAEHGTEKGKYDIDLHDDQPGRPRYWGGGPVQNATTSLNEAYGDGLQNLIYLISPNIVNPGQDRKITPAPPRYYMVHAAQRLAFLIETIRRASGGDDQTINLMCHSQGNIIGLLAQAMVSGRRRADTLILNNPPYCMEQPDIGLRVIHAKDTFLLPTPESRVKTFVKIAELTAKAVEKGPSLDILNQRMMPMIYGATKDKPVPKVVAFNNINSNNLEPKDERDNRGKVFLNFCLHDRLVGVSPIKGIGWLGINNEVAAKMPNFFQRAFAGGETVGSKPHPYYFFKAWVGKEFWFPRTDYILPVLHFQLLAVNADPDKSRVVPVNAPAVPEPVLLKKRDGTKAGDEGAFDRKSAPVGDPSQNDQRELPYLLKNYPYQNTIRITLQGGDPRFGKFEAVRESKTDHDARAAKSLVDFTDHGDIVAHTDYPQIVSNVIAYDLAIGTNVLQRDQKFWEHLHLLANWMTSDPYFLTKNRAALTYEDVTKNGIPEAIDQETSGVYFTNLAIDSAAKIGEAEVQAAELQLAVSKALADKIVDAYEKSLALGKKGLEAIGEAEMAQSEAQLAAARAAIDGIKDGAQWTVDKAKAAAEQLKNAGKAVGETLNKYPPVIVP